MQTAASARPTQGPAPFAADLPPVPAPITAPIDPADVHDAEVQLLRAIVDAQRDALDLVLAHGHLSPSLRSVVAEALIASELAR